MQIELRDLELFVSVAEAGGLRRAAAQTRVQQSVITRRIRGLEDRLGVSLFERHRGGVRMTNAGQRLLPEARSILAKVDDTIRLVGAAGEANEGVLRIGIVASISTGFLRDLLKSWLAQHPKVDLELVGGAPREHLGALTNRRLDVTFVTGELNGTSWDVEALWSEAILAALPANHPLAKDDCEIAMTDLRGERFIVSRASPGPEIHDFIVSRLAGVCRPRVDLLGLAREPLLGMVGLGFGVTLTTASSNGVVYPDVRFVPLVGESVTFNAVWSPENDNPALRRFLSDARLLSKRYGAPSRTLDPLP